MRHLSCIWPAGVGFRGAAAGVVFWCLALTSAWPAEQFRAAWADVFHDGLQSSDKMDTMISNLVAGHYNAVIVQVLSYMDNETASHGAYWKSSIVPWSGSVSSGFDPLTNLCERAHTNGIEVHAWLGGSDGGMYRVSSKWPPPGNTRLAAHPDWMMVPRASSETGAVTPFVVNTGGNVTNFYLLDMGSSDAQEYIISIVRELVSKYPIDGINWDDEIDGSQYTAGLGFPACSATTNLHSGLARYRANTGYSGKPPATDSAYNDYRRRFKHELIARCQAEIQSIKTNPCQPLRHTAATMAYGGAPPDCGFSNEEAYTYYSDWPTMLTNGWLDAAIPMVYKKEPTYHDQFTNWCNRSYSCWQGNRDVFIGLGACYNTRSNTMRQLQFVYGGQPEGKGLAGAATFSYGVPSSDGGDWWGYVAANVYTDIVGTPKMGWRDPTSATNGMMWGRVQDAKTGLYLDDATVTVSGGPTVRTDGNGYYVATMIPATTNGTVHATTASKAGRASQTNAGATVIAADIVRYDFVLKGYTTTTLSPVSPNPVCAGTAVTLTASVSGTNSPGGSVEFFDGATSLGTAALAGGTATKVVSGLGAGTHNSITGSYLGDGINAPSVSAARAVTINAVPEAPVAGNNGPICAGATLNLSASTVSGGTYAWTGPNGFSSSAQNPSVPNATTAAAGQYDVTVTVNGCTSTAGTTTVAVNSVPDAPLASSDSPVLPGGTLHLRASDVSGATYAWTGPNGFSSTDQNPTISLVTRQAHAGEYGVRATASGCTSAAGATRVIINTPPAAPDHAVSVVENGVLVLAVAELLAGANDADAGDILSIAAAGPSSTNGPANNVLLDGGTGVVTYTPATNYTGSDLFSYTVSDNFGGTATASVRVSVTPAAAPPPVVVIPPTYDSASGTFRVTFAGVPGAEYSVEWAAALSNGGWTALKTVTANSNGLFEVADTVLPAAGERYYRVPQP